MGLSYLSRTMRVLRAEGWSARKVEYHCPYDGKTYDLFGFMDILAIAPDAAVGIQVCSPGTHLSHKRKILANEDVPKWLKSGNRIQIRSWSKRKIKRGQKPWKWVERVEEIELSMLCAIP